MMEKLRHLKLTGFGEPDLSRSHHCPNVITLDIGDKCKLFFSPDFLDIKLSTFSLPGRFLLSLNCPRAVGGHDKGGVSQSEQIVFSKWLGVTIRNKWTKVAWTLLALDLSCLPEDWLYSRNLGKKIVNFMEFYQSIAIILQIIRAPVWISRVKVFVNIEAALSLFHSQLNSKSKQTNLQTRFSKKSWNWKKNYDFCHFFVITRVTRLITARGHEASTQLEPWSTSQQLNVI